MTAIITPTGCGGCACGKLTIGKNYNITNITKKGVLL